MTTGRNGAKRALRQTRYRFDEEPSLQELIDDPVMQAIMARDGVERATLVNLVIEMRIRLNGRTERRTNTAVELVCD